MSIQFDYAKLYIGGHEVPCVGGVKYDPGPTPEDIDTTGVLPLGASKYEVSFDMRVEGGSYEAILAFLDRGMSRKRRRQMRVEHSRWLGDVRRWAWEASTGIHEYGPKPAPFGRRNGR